MTPGYALTGINNPMLGLGTLGLSTGGMYSSCNPYTSGLYGGYGFYGGNYANSIFNMYRNMQTTQQNMEIAAAGHTNTMNGIMNSNEVSAVGNSQSALVSKILQNSSVMALVDNLIDKVHKGELEGACNQYKDLKKQIYATYRDEISARGDKENPHIAVRKIIDTLYTKEMELGGVQNACLRDDIKQYGESAFMNGVQQARKPGHDKKYIEEALYDIYGEDISNVASNEGARSVGMFTGGLLHLLRKSLTVGGMAAVATTGVAGIIKGGASLIGQGNNVSFPKIAKGGLKGAGLLTLCVAGYELFKTIYNTGEHQSGSMPSYS